MGRMGQAKVDAVVCVVDACALSRGLYLAVQLQELQIPTIVVINMMDLAERRRLEIDIDKLAARLNMPVIPAVARDNKGLDKLLTEVGRIVESSPKTVNSLEDSLAHLPLNTHELAALQCIAKEIAPNAPRLGIGESLWLLNTSREQWGSGYSDIQCQCVLREQQNLHGRDGKVAIKEARQKLARRLIEARYTKIDSVLQGIVRQMAKPRSSWSMKLDKVLLHPIAGMVIFVAVMLVVFQAVFAWAQPIMDGIDHIMSSSAVMLSHVLPPGLLRSMLLSGVLAGVGNVLTFLPQIAFLFFGIALLEESGYMAQCW